MKRRGDRGRSRFPYATGAIAALALALAAIEPAAEWLQLDRAALAAGEWWRLVTGHLVHYSNAHLVWDVAMFACLAAVIESRDRRRLWQLLAASAAAVSAGVLWFSRFDSYRGLSGIDSALFVAVALELLRSRAGSTSRWPRYAGGVALFAILAKVCVEAAIGVPLFAGELAPGVVVAPIAHLAGAFSAVTGFGCRRTWAKWVNPDDWTRLDRLHSR